MSYKIEGMPEAVAHAANNWILSSFESEKTMVDMKITLRGFSGKLMQPFMKIILGKFFSSITNDLKYYVENGKPVEGKLKYK